MHFKAWGWYLIIRSGCWTSDYRFWGLTEGKFRLEMDPIEQFGNDTLEFDEISGTLKRGCQYRHGLCMETSMVVGPVNLENMVLIWHIQCSQIKSSRSRFEKNLEIPCTAQRQRVSVTAMWFRTPQSETLQLGTQWVWITWLFYIPTNSSPWWDFV